MSDHTYEILKRLKKQRVIPDEIDRDYSTGKPRGVLSCQKETEFKRKKKEDYLDKKIKCMIKDITDKLFKKSKILDKFRKEWELFFLQKIWEYHRAGKKKVWEVEYKKSIGSPNLIGEKIKIFILAIIYDFLTSNRISIYQKILELPYELQHEEKIVLKKIIKELSYMIKVLEKDKEFKKSKKKLGVLLKKKYPLDYFNLNKVDKTSQKYKEEGFISLFKIDSKKVKKSINYEFFSELTNKEIERKLNVIKKRYVENVGVKGFLISQKIIKTLQNPNKARNGFGGACTYLIGWRNYLKGYWIFPVKSISTWAKFYGVYRTSFKNRIDEVGQSKGWSKYLSDRINFWKNNSANC